MWGYVDKCVDMVLWRVLQVLLQDLDQALLLIEIRSIDRIVVCVDIDDVASASLRFAKRKFQCYVYLGDSWSVQNIYFGLAWK